MLAPQNDKLDEQILEYCKTSPDCRVNHIARALEKPYGTIYYRVFDLARRGRLSLDESSRGAVRVRVII